MEKIKLTKRGKKILLLMKVGKFKPVKSDTDELNLLTVEGLGQGKRAEDNSYIIFQLTDKGKTYIQLNPKLKNPSILDDKKYVVTTIISIIAILLSIIIQKWNS